MVELDAWRFFATGGSGDMIVQAIQEQNSKKEHQMAPIVSNLTFNFKHKWICAQCFKNGQTVERKGKTHYCAARISHSWRDPMLYAHIGFIKNQTFSKGKFILNPHAVGF